MHDAYEPKNGRYVRVLTGLAIVAEEGLPVDDFVRDFEADIQRLLEEAKSGCYRASPVLRVHIPKGDGRTTRPIGIPTF